MKNIFLTGLALITLGFATQTLASPIDELRSKISQSTLSETVKQDCLKALKEENKTVIKDCIEKLKKTRVKNLAGKVRKLETKVSALKNAGQNTDRFRNTVRNANNKLGILESY